jgi:hypothetical protein
MKMLKKIGLITLAAIGAISIILVSYTYISQHFNNQQTDEISSSESHTISKSDILKIWADEGNLLAAKNSQLLVENEINDKNFTASTMIPVHYEGFGAFTVDGILKTHDGTGRYLNYSCHVGCRLSDDPRDERNWWCYEFYVNGKKIITSFESKWEKEKYGK